MGYISNFIVYTLAMVGVIVVALLVFKNATSVCQGKTSKYLKIIDTISLGQRKNLYIVSTGKEQFLIAGDVNNTCLISKLDSFNNSVSANSSESLNCIKPTENSFKETLESLPRQSFMDKRSGLNLTSDMYNKKSNNSVIRNLAEIMKH